MVTKNIHIKKKLSPYLVQANARLQPIIAYWYKRAPRERQLLAMLGMVIILTILLYIISGLMSWKDTLQEDFIKEQKYRLEAEIISKQLKDITLSSANQFSNPTVELITTDATNVLDVKNPQINLDQNSGNLSVNIDKAKFISVMLFLDQLRKTYALFPSSLQITRTTPSGYVSFNATFALTTK